MYLLLCYNFKLHTNKTNKRKRLSIINTVLTVIFVFASEKLKILQTTNDRNETIDEIYIYNNTYYIE